MCVLCVYHSFVHQVLISFDAFDMESNYDYVNVFDGSDTSAPSLGTFTGSAIPADILTNGNSMTVQITSDSSVSRQGFSATVTYMGKL